MIASFFGMILGSLSFWWGRTRLFDYFTEGLWEFDSVPITIFPGRIQTFTSFILPFLFATAIPAQFVLQQVGIEAYGQSLLILFVWFIILAIIQEKMWQKGLLKHDGKG